MKKIGIQGIQGSFSEIAAHQFIKTHSINDYEFEYLTSSENVLNAIEKKLINFGIIAIENTRGGIVIESLYALAKYRCTIIDKFQITVHQNLMALPGISIKDISEIHSHPQALRQCQNFISKHLANADLIEEEDTAKAAQRLQNNKLPKTAAVIANKACAKFYSLNLLAEEIQDLKEKNLTLFLAVKK